MSLTSIVRALSPASAGESEQPVGGRSARGLRERGLREAFAHEFRHGEPVAKERGDKREILPAAGDELDN